MIIACLGMKGGGGKTTLATNLAASLAAKPDKRVLLLDTDEQASALRWSAERPEERPQVATIHLPNSTEVRERFSEFENQFSHIIMDGSPRVDHLSTVTLGIADLVFLPLQPSPLDIWATEQLVERIQTVQKIKPGFQAVFVLNRYNPATLISRSALTALQNLELPVLNASMGQRVAYGEAIIQGLSVTEYSDPKAAAEINALCEAFEEIERGGRPFHVYEEQIT